LLQSAGCPRELNVKNNAIGAFGAVQLLEAASKSHSLQVLDLSNNVIDDSVGLCSAFCHQNLIPRQVAPAVLAFCSVNKGSRVILSGNCTGSRTKAAAAASFSYGCTVLV
jgi:hypothetical protein